MIRLAVLAAASLLTAACATNATHGQSPSSAAQAEDARNEAVFCADVARWPQGTPPAEMNSAEMLCQQVPPLASNPSEMACNAEAVNRWLAMSTVDRLRSAEAADKAMRLSGARTLRWIRPGMMVTMDYREDRLNLHVDVKDKILKARCG